MKYTSTAGNPVLDLFRVIGIKENMEPAREEQGIPYRWLWEYIGKQDLVDFFKINQNEENTTIIPLGILVGMNDQTEEGMYAGPITLTIGKGRLTITILWWLWFVFSLTFRWQNLREVKK